MKFSYPVGSLSKKDEHNVCCLSFPDSHSSTIGDTTFCFRFRCEKTKCNVDGGNHSYKFGYVFFRQRKDETRRRGYFQQSIVLISSLPLVTLFEKCASVIGPMFFVHGKFAFYSACRNIVEWDDPIDGSKVELPLLGTVLRVELHLPRHISASVPTIETSTLDLFSASATLIDLACHIDHTMIGGSFQEMNLYHHFRHSLGNLWFLWELAITGRPLLIISKTPAGCAHAVLGLTSLISPIVFQGDFRPYFTVYDDDFKHFSALHDHKMLPGVVLGITNPFFLKVWNHFPNILFLRMRETVESCSLFSSSPRNALASEPGLVPGDSGSINLHPSPSSSFDAFPNGEKKSRFMRRFSASKKPTITNVPLKSRECLSSVDDSKLICKETPLLMPERQVLDQLLTRPAIDSQSIESEESILINNMVLRKHFREITVKFLQPFQLYFEYDEAVCSSPSFNPYLQKPSLPKFQERTFLERVRGLPKDELQSIPLRTEGVYGSKRKSLIKLYGSFFRSPHFHFWFNSHREKAKRSLEKAIHDAIKEAAIRQLLNGISISNAIRMAQVIQEWLDVALNTPHPDPKSTGPADRMLCAALRSHLNAVFAALPKRHSERLRRKHSSLSDVDPFMQQLSLLETTPDLSSLPNGHRLRIQGVTEHSNFPNDPQLLSQEHKIDLVIHDDHFH
uniref:Protein DENND6A n=1 Tax=Hirondellea gigas TaxID=1518452 RepID=A0A6A7FWQ2_9CRUS